MRIFFCWAMMAAAVIVPVGRCAVASGQSTRQSSSNSIETPAAAPEMHPVRSGANDDADGCSDTGDRIAGGDNRLPVGLYAAHDSAKSGEGRSDIGSGSVAGSNRSAARRDDVHGSGRTRSTLFRRVT